MPVLQPPTLYITTSKNLHKNSGSLHTQIDEAENKTDDFSHGRSHTLFNLDFEITKFSYRTKTNNT